MNPEDNNPLTNTGMPDLGIPADPVTPTDLNGGSVTGQPVVNSPLADIPSGFTTNTTGALSQDMAPSIEEQGVPAIEEPLVPAGPVPGSIGSVTSVPPVASNDQPSSPEQVTAPVSQADPIPAPTAANPQPQTAYNPFAQQPVVPASEPSAPAPAPAGMTGLGGMPAPGTPAHSAPTMAPPVQPTNAPKAKANMKFSPITMLLAVVAGVAIIISVVLAIMLVKAKNDKEIVYAPLTPSEGTSESAEEILTCSRNSDFNYLIGYDHEVIGDQRVTLNYADGKLVSLSMDNTATFDSEDDATVAKDNYANTQTVWETLVSNFETDGSTMKATTMVSDDEELSSSDAGAVIYGDESNTDLSLSAVQANYEAQGYTCTLNQ